LASSQIVYGSLDSVEVVDADAKKGAFLITHFINE
jgi:oxepin-CoA hydrolase/3-oxo-5,6-dehydrosuberyl-CoA semialdehyde dehydrogenase